MPSNVLLAKNSFERDVLMRIFLECLKIAEIFPRHIPTFLSRSIRKHFGELSITFTWSHSLNFWRCVDDYKTVRATAGRSQRKCRTCKMVGMQMVIRWIMEWKNIYSRYHFCNKNTYYKNDTYLQALGTQGGMWRQLITIINACGWNGFQINCSLLNMCYSIVLQLTRCVQSLVMYSGASLALGVLPA